MEQNKHIEYLIGLNRIRSTEVKEIQEIIRAFIDPKCSICTTCPSQIRFAQKRLASWYYSNVKTEEKEQIVVPDAPKKKTCQACKKKTNTPKK